ncbi:MAG: SRPBCC family protein [Deltaproteobacteria bacterium]|nr:SRPBCC family protein [Deltaproteobacteria bacterium]
MNHNEIVRNKITGVNVPTYERVLSGALGVAALVFGIRRRSALGAAAAGLGAAATIRAVTGRCPMYRARAMRDGIHVRRNITIQCTPREVYDLWRDLTNLPRFLDHVSTIEVEDEKISKWTVLEGPAKLSWRAEILEDVPGRLLTWRSLPGGDVWNEGSIQMREAPGDRGTIVEVKLTYRPPGGMVVASILHGFLRKLTHVQLGAELARLQQLIETGEIATGARRPEYLDKRDKAMTASDLRTQPEPVVSAESSTWQGV